MDKAYRFASQVKALGETGAASAEYDLAGLAGFLLFGAVPEPFTIYRDIECLPAGSQSMDRRARAGLARTVSELGRTLRAGGR